MVRKNGLGNLQKGERCEAISLPDKPLEFLSTDMPTWTSSCFSLWSAVSFTTSFFRMILCASGSATSRSTTHNFLAIFACPPNSLTALFLSFSNSTFMRTELSAKVPTRWTSYTPGDHIFFLRKNLYGNTSCVSNVFFLKKNEKFTSRKNIIKMKHFIHIFFLQKIVYLTEIKMFEKYYIFPCQFFWINMHFRLPLSLI
jgi:hypothetical protein